MVKLYVNAEGTVVLNPQVKKATIGSGAEKQQANFKSSASAPIMTYQGGRHIASAEVYAIFMGDWTSTADQLRATRLTQFVKDLIASDWMKIMNQYNFTGGTFKQAIFLPDTVTTLTGKTFDGALQAAIDSKLIPEPTKAVGVDSLYIVYLDNKMMISDDSIGIAVCEPKSDTAFAYHHVFNTKMGNDFFYAVIASVDDECISYSCPNPASCSLSTKLTQEQRQTQLTSHELAETITNPDGTGWYDANSGDEIGDTCNGRSTTLTVGANTWTIQKLFSQSESNRTNGATTCVSSASGVNDAPNTPPSVDLAAVAGNNTVLICQAIIGISLFGIVTLIYKGKKK